MVDLELEDDLRAARSAVRKFHPPQGAAPPHLPSQRESQPARPRSKPAAAARKAGSGWLTWTALSLGTMGFSCGAVLLVWAFCTGRSELWNVGLPLTFLGQSGLVLGLILQLEGLLRASREQSRELQQLDDQLDELRHTTTLLGTTHNSAAQAFYVHMAEGGNPHLLLADLKGQLDLLAVQLARRAEP